VIAFIRTRSGTATKLVESVRRAQRNAKMMQATQRPRYLTDIAHTDFFSARFSLSNASNRAFSCLFSVANASPCLDLSNGNLLKLLFCVVCVNDGTDKTATILSERGDFGAPKFCTREIDF
jgi:hypothetical protein